MKPLVCFKIESDVSNRSPYQLIFCSVQVTELISCFELFFRNYNSELFAFQARISEKFDEGKLREAFITPGTGSLSFLMRAPLEDFRAVFQAAEEFHCTFICSIICKRL